MSRSRSACACLPVRVRTQTGTYADRLRRAFTLVEILLVMAIIGVISAITLPSFVSSIRGNRLRTSGRTVVAIARYARSMALLHQSEIEIAFMLDKSTVVVASRNRPLAALQTTGEVEVAIAEARARMAQTAANATGVWTRANREGAGSGSEVGSASSIADGARLPDVFLMRVLDGVMIESVKKSNKDGGGASPTDGVRVLYRTNGRCDPYEVLLRDHEQHSLRVKVDALSTTTVERETP